MVWSLFSSENKGNEGAAVGAVEFLRRAVVATMGCFFGCFGIKESHSHFVVPPEPVAHRNKNALSSLFVSDEDTSFRKGEEGWNPQREEVDVRELKDQAKFLKACGTLPETPVEIRKTSEKFVDMSAQNEQQRSLDFNSWLSKASIEKLKPENQPVESPAPVKISAEWITGAGSLVDTPSSCMTDGHNTGRVSTSSIHCRDLQKVITPRDEQSNETNCSETSSVSAGVFAPSVQCKNKSVRFDCESDRSPFSSKGSSSETASLNLKGSGSGGHYSVSKPSPYPTPLKLTDEMQTPGTVFPAYSNNVAHGKTTRVRSQYVYSVLNPVESSSKWKELKDEHFDSKHPSDEHSDSMHLSESLKLNDEVTLMSTSMLTTSIKGLSVEKEMKDEAGLASWLKPPSSKQDDSKKRCGPFSGENVHSEQTLGDRPILGMVAAHWNDDDTSRISPKWWDGNGIPNSTNKYKEDQKVSWHATPFEERLEKALSEETFISQRKPISGTPAVEFNEAEESDTALSHLQSSTHFNSVVSF